MNAPLASGVTTSPVSSDDVVLLARRLLPRARAAFQAVPESERAAMCVAVDAFVRAPAPSTFLTAFRALEQAQRRALLERTGAGVLRRAFAEGVGGLRKVSSLPPPAIEALARHLPIDVRAGDRLHALAALAGAYHELSGRLAADSDRRRRLWKTIPRRRPRV